MQQLASSPLLQHTSISSCCGTTRVLTASLCWTERNKQVAKDWQQQRSNKRPRHSEALSSYAGHRPSPVINLLTLAKHGPHVSDSRLTRGTRCQSHLPQSALARRLRLRKDPSPLPTAQHHTAPLAVWYRTLSLASNCIDSVIVDGRGYRSFFVLQRRETLTGRQSVARVDRPSPNRGTAPSPWATRRQADLPSQSLPLHPASGALQRVL